MDSKRTLPDGAMHLFLERSQLYPTYSRKLPKYYTLVANLALSCILTATEVRPGSPTHRVVVVTAARAAAAS